MSYKVEDLGAGAILKPLLYSVQVIKIRLLSKNDRPVECDRFFRWDCNYDDCGDLGNDAG